MAEKKLGNIDFCYITGAWSGTTKKRVYYPNVDYYYGPYNSVEEAWSTLSTSTSSYNGKSQLCLGKTVGVIENGKIVEYWFESACASSSDLVKKGNTEEISSDALIFKGEITAENFKALDPTTLSKNFCYLITDKLEIGEIKYLPNNLAIYNGSGWNYCQLKETDVCTLKACATPETKEGEEFSRYQEIMSALSYLTDDTEVVTVGALKVILGQLLSNYPRIEDVTE